jgi:MFS superfamily sulfate permease-like transporter
MPRGLPFENCTDLVLRSLDNPRWILNDVLAGITVGVLLIPQSLAYAKIATIPGQYGLMSSWLPNFLYFFMGTSKGALFLEV